MLKENKFLKRAQLFRLHFEITSFSDLFTVKGGTAVINILKGMFLIADANITSGRIRFICKFVWVVKHLLRTQGPSGTVKFLKAAGVSLQQSIGGQRVEDCGKLGSRISRTRSGLPRFIPSQLRTLIRQGDPTTTKITLTLINVFRVFTFPGRLKLQTISKGNTGSGILNKEVYSYIPLFVNHFVRARFSKPELFRRLKVFSSENLNAF